MRISGASRRETAWRVGAARLDESGGVHVVRGSDAAGGTGRGHSAADAPCDALAGERGDVPGWVLITLMTAGLVVVIWGLAAAALTDVFNQAIARVVGM